MHDPRHVQMMGALADQLLSEYGDAMHEAVQTRRQVTVTNPAAAATTKAAAATKTKTKAAPTTRMVAKKKPNSFFAWLFGT